MTPPSFFNTFKISALLLLNEEEVKKHYTTYLAGPMQAIKYSGAGWRTFLTKILQRYNIKVQDPVKCEVKKTGYAPAKNKEVLAYLTALVIQGDIKAQQKFLKMMRFIVKTDLKMVERSDFIIAQVIEDVVSIGTTTEILHAAAKKIPVYVIYSGRPQYFSNWLLYAVVQSGGMVFREKKKNGFDECVNFLRIRFKLEELERNGKASKRKNTLR